MAHLLLVLLVVVAASGLGLLTWAVVDEVRDRARVRRDRDLVERLRPYGFEADRTRH